MENTKKAKLDQLKQTVYDWIGSKSPHREQTETKPMYIISWNNKEENRVSYKHS